MKIKVSWINAVQLILLSLAIILFIGVFPHYNNLVSDRLTTLQEDFFSYLQRQTGRLIEYDSISPSIFQYLEVRNLKVFYDNPEKETSIESLKFKIYYSLFNLLKEDGNLIQQMELENTSVFLHHSKDKDLFQFLVDSFSDTGKGFPDLKLLGRNITLGYVGEEFNLSLNKLNFSLDYKNEILFFEVSGNLFAEFSNFLDLGSIKTSFNIKGSVDKGLKNSVIEVRTEDIITDLFVLGPQSFQINKNASVIELIKTRDRLPFDLRVTVDMEKSLINANLKTEELLVSTILKEIKLPSSMIAPWLETISTGNFSVVWNYSNNNLNYSYQGKIRLPNSPFKISLELDTDLKGTLDAMNIKYLSLITPYGNLHFSGQWNLKTLIPSGLFRTSRFQLPLPFKPVITTIIRIQETQDGIQIKAPTLELNGIQFQQLNAQIQLGKPIIPVFISLEDSNEGRILFSGEWNQEQENMEGVFNLENLLITPYVKVLLPKLSTELEKEFSLARITAASQFQWNNSFQTASTLVQVFWDQQPNKKLNLDFSIVENRFTLNSGEVKWNDFQVSAIGESTFSGLSMDFKLTVFLWNKAYELKGLYDHTTGSIKMSGDYDLEINGIINPLGESQLQIQFKNLEVAFEDLKTLNTAKMQFNLQNQSNWSLLISDWESQVTNTGYGKNFTLSLTGYLNPEELYLNSLDFQDTISHLKGDLKARYTAFFEKINWDFNLSGEQQESYMFNGEILRGEMTALAKVTRAPLDRFNLYPFTGFFQGEVNLSGNWDEYDLNGSFELLEARYNNDRITASLDFFATPRQFLLEKIQLGYLNHTLDTGRAQYNVSDGILKASANFTGRLGTTTIKSRLSSEWNLKEDFAIGSLNNLEFDRITGRISLTENYQNKQKLDNLLVQFSKVRDIITIRAGNPLFFQARINRETFRLQLLEPFPLRMEVQGKLEKGILDAKISQVFLDLENISALVNSDVFSIQKGTLSGELSILGPVNDPNFTGKLRLKDFVSNALFVQNSLGPIASDLVFINKQIRLPKIEVQSGFGRISVEGLIGLDHWGIDEYDFNASIQELYPVEANFKVGVLNATGTATGTLQLKGDAFKGKFFGNLQADDTLLLLELGSARPRSTGSAYSMEIDLRLKTGKRVEFLWPIPAYPRIRAFATPQQDLRIHIPDLGGRDFSVVGAIDIRGGEINWLNNTFFLKRGQLAFNENQDRFDPRIVLRGELRQRDAIGPVIIYLFVDDYLSQFSPRFESSPPKTQSEINGIIGYGFIAPEEYSGEIVNTALDVAADFGTSFLLRPLEDTLKKNLGLDILTIKTSLIKNAILGNTGDERISPQDYLDNTSLFLGKYIGDHLFLEGNLSFQNEPINPFSLTSEKTLSPELEIGLEMQTPFFLINWRFKPKNPSELFVTDNVLSFQWTINY